MMTEIENLGLIVALFSLFLAFFALKSVRTNTRDAEKLMKEEEINKIYRFIAERFEKIDPEEIASEFYQKPASKISEDEKIFAMNKIKKIIDFEISQIVHEYKKTDRDFNQQDRVA